MPTLDDLSLIAHDELAAYPRDHFELKWCSIGVVIDLWADELEVNRGIGNRWIAPEPTGRRVRERKIFIWPCHRYPRLMALWSMPEIPGATQTITLWIPVRMPVSQIAALTCHLLARASPTNARIRRARTRLRDAGVRVRDYLKRPPTMKAAS